MLSTKFGVVKKIKYNNMDDAYACNYKFGGLFEVPLVFKEEHHVIKAETRIRFIEQSFGQLKILAAKKIAEKFKTDQPDYA